jgi:hypothetical protein
VLYVVIHPKFSQYPEPVGTVAYPYQSRTEVPNSLVVSTDDGAELPEIDNPLLTVIVPPGVHPLGRLVPAKFQ